MENQTNFNNPSENLNNQPKKRRVAWIIIASIIILVALFLLFNFLNSAEARSGCCSWHGGVCGCRCCDGTSLSSTCAPYYPKCSGGSNYIKSTPYKQSTASLSDSGGNRNNDDRNYWWIIIPIGVVGGYIYLRRKK
jgi:hypothetical protein